MSISVSKERCQIGLFFKWIKQNLRIKSFLGASRNAVLSQVWVAIGSYLLLAYLRFMRKLVFAMPQILRLLQLNLFDCHNLMALLRGDSPEPLTSPLQTQLNFG
jgi:hypothetical protein